MEHGPVQKDSEREDVDATGENVAHPIFSPGKALDTSECSGPGSPQGSLQTLSGQHFPLLELFILAGG